MNRQGISGKSRRRCEDNIRMDLKEIGNTRNWVDSAQGSPFERGIEPPGSNNEEIKKTNNNITYMTVRYGLYS